AGMQTSGKLQALTVGIEQTFQTDAQGVATLSNLAYGAYRLEVSKEGFVTQSMRMDVESDTPVSRTITMQLGAASTTVDVVATTPLAGSELSLQQIPAPVQTATQEDLNNSGALDLSELLN